LGTTEVFLLVLTSVRCWDVAGDRRDGWGPVAGAVGKYGAEVVGRAGVSAVVGIDVGTGRGKDGGGAAEVLLRVSERLKAPAGAWEPRPLPRPWAGYPPRML